MALSVEVWYFYFHEPREFIQGLGGGGIFFFGGGEKWEGVHIFDSLEPMKEKEPKDKDDMSILTVQHTVCVINLWEKKSENLETIHSINEDSSPMNTICTLCVFFHVKLKAISLNLSMHIETVCTAAVL